MLRVGRSRRNRRATPAISDPLLDFGAIRKNDVAVGTDAADGQAKVPFPPLDRPNTFSREAGDPFPAVESILWLTHVCTGC
jgi:hypothetical protein